MNKIIYWGGVAVLGVALGLASAFYALRMSGPGDGAAVGPWKVSLSAGSLDADMYTRARIARYGLLALDKKETLYYLANTDSAGEPLSGSCTYALKGADLAARWWSLTAYGPDSYLIANDANIFSFTKTTVKHEADGGYIVSISADKQDGNWLPVKAGERFDITARFYNPDPAVSAAPQSAVLPTIVKESCK